MIARRFYVIFLYYLVFEGAARKWLLPSASNELFLLKDVLLGAAVAALHVLERKRLTAIGPLSFKPHESAMWQLWLVIVLVGVAVTGFSLTGLIGLRYYLVPLMVLLVHPVLASTPQELETFFGRYLALCGAVCVLGFVQFNSAPDALINRYSWSPNSEMDVATFGEVSERASDHSFVRITGTFSYISPYVSYLQFAYFAALAMFMTARSERGRLWYAVLLTGILANLFMTGSRGPTLMCLMLSMLFLPSLRRALGGKFGFVGLVLGTAVLAGGMWMARDVAVALLERHEAAGDAGERIYGALFLPFLTFAHTDFWGEGLGSTFLGLGQLSGSGSFEYRFDEVMQDRIAVEVGLPGYAFFLALKVYFLLSTWRLLRRTRNFSIKVWTMASFAYQALLMWTIPLYNSIAAVFYFFSIALFAWLRRLDDRERAMAGSAHALSGHSPSIGAGTAPRPLGHRR